MGEDILRITHSHPRDTDVFMTKHNIHQQKIITQLPMFRSHKSD